MKRLLVVIFVVGLTPGPTTASDTDALRRALAGNHWISYAPTHYFPAESPAVLPTSDSLRADMRVLHLAGFTGLVTYGAQPEGLPEVARRVGFKAMLLGIWDPSSSVERSLAIAAVRKNRDFVLGVIVGNEGLLTGRYTVESLCQSMREIQGATGKPVSTTEPVDWILSERRIAECSTFVTVNAHPLFSNRREPSEAVRWTEEAWDAVREKVGDKPLLFKEVGLPSAGAPDLSQEAQRDYYIALTQTPVVFSYFEAFDATPRFKEGFVEQSWGLWTADRQPKAIVAALPWSTGRRRR